VFSKVSRGAARGVLCLECLVGRSLGAALALALALVDEVLALALSLSFVDCFELFELCDGGSAEDDRHLLTLEVA